MSPASHTPQPAVPDPPPGRAGARGAHAAARPGRSGPQAVHAHRAGPQRAEAFGGSLAPHGPGPYRNPDDPTGTTMSNECNLTFNLRLRGLSKPEIGGVLDEVRAHEAAAGPPAEVEFGRGVREAVPQDEEADTGKHHHDDRSRHWRSSTFSSWSCWAPLQSRNSGVRRPDHTPAGARGCPGRVPDQLLPARTELPCRPLRFVQPNGGRANQSRRLRAVF